MTQPLAERRATITIDGEMGVLLLSELHTMKYRFADTHLEGAIDVLIDNIIKQLFLSGE